MIKKEGFTLVEILISIAIIGIVVVSILPVFDHAFRNIFSAGHKSQEVHNAKKEILTELSAPGSTTIVTTTNVTLYFDGDFAFDLPTKKFSSEGTFKMPGGNDSNLIVDYYVLD